MIKEPNFKDIMIFKFSKEKLLHSINNCEMSTVKEKRVGQTDKRDRENVTDNKRENIHKTCLNGQWGGNINGGYSCHFEDYLARSIFY